MVWWAAASVGEGERAPRSRARKGGIADEGVHQKRENEESRVLTMGPDLWSGVEDEGDLRRRETDGSQVLTFDSGQGSKAPTEGRRPRQIKSSPSIWKKGGVVSVAKLCAEKRHTRQCQFKKKAKVRD